MPRNTQPGRINMNETNPPTAIEQVKPNKLPERILLAIFLLIVLFFARHFLLRQYDAVRLAMFSRHIATADQVIAIGGANDVQLKFAGDDLKDIIRALSSARTAREPHSEFMSSATGRAAFYRGTNRLGEITLTTGLFNITSGGWRGPSFYSGALEPLLNTPMLEALRNSYGMPLQRESTSNQKTTSQSKAR